MKISVYRKLSIYFFLLPLMILFTPQISLSREKPLRINGSTTVNLVAVEAAEIISEKEGFKIFVDTQGGSSGGISSLADHIADIGMISKPLSIKDRSKYPQIDFQLTQIGFDAIALVVQKEVFDQGVKALTKKQIQLIYEGKIKNWKEVSGPNLPIFFYNKEPGRGTWEVFAKWLYGNLDRVPAISHAEVGGNEEGRTKVATTRGAITQLSFSWAKNHPKIAPLGIKLEDGTIIMPTQENIETGLYPIVRPLNFVTNGQPQNRSKLFLDFVLSSQGQKIVKKYGYLPVEK